MAGFDYISRRKLMQAWAAWLNKQGTLLPMAQKRFVNIQDYSVPEESAQWLENIVKENPDMTLSAVFKEHLEKLVHICVPEGRESEFYYAIDQLNQYQMTAGWYRRSVRGKSYLPFVRRAVKVLLSYSWLKYFKVDIVDIWLGQAEPETFDFCKTQRWNYAEILAAEIDMGNEKTIQGVKDVFFGENNTALLTYQLIMGVAMSKNEDLYKILGDFLLAARLQEGSRQAVCETMDAGRPESFMYLFKVIEDNNLIRYSAVKRAVSTWIGIFDESSVDRITDKLVKLMGQCLRDPAACEENLKTNDSIAISCALWAKGFYDANTAIDAVIDLVKNGTKNQKMAASYFNRSLQFEKLKMQAAKEVIFTHPDDLELVACFMPSFMSDTRGKFMNCIKPEKEGYFSVRDLDAVEPKRISVTELFENEEEAEKTYHILKQIMAQMPKKGIDLNPCIFPWYKISMSKSDLASRICLIAWMLQKEEYLDEAAALIPSIGQGTAYAGSERAAAARVLLYKPKSRARKDVLIDLLHNPEEYTLKAAFKLADAAEWEPEDYAKIEKNLKYKKGRAGTLTLLKKQDPEDLCVCIGRLLADKSEECHMGALDMALEIKKEDPEEFEKIRPHLALLTEPTGKEQVLLKELTGGVSEAQDILTQPGYGFYDTTKEWVLPPVKVDEQKAAKLFQYNEDACITVMKKLDALVEQNKNLEYKILFGEERTLGAGLGRCTRQDVDDQRLHPIDGYPFKELWLEFYEKEIGDPELLLETYLYRKCRELRDTYEQQIDFYKKVFGSGLFKKPPFKKLNLQLQFNDQVQTVLYNLFMEKVPAKQKAEWGLIATAKVVSVLDDSNDTYVVDYKQWNGTIRKITKLTVDIPILSDARTWLMYAEGEDWNSAFTLKFKLKQRYEKMKGQNSNSWQRYEDNMFLGIDSFVQCYVRGIWDKDMFYKAIFRFFGITSLFGAISAVEQKGPVASRDARVRDLNDFFGFRRIKPVEGKYQFDNIGDEMPEMTFAHELYHEIIPQVLKVELKRGEQDTPFSKGIHGIQVVYGIDTLIQILTALGKDTLERGYTYYYSASANRRSVLSHLLQACRPYPHETAEDLKKALKGTDITKKRLVEVAMYAKQWIPMVEEYLKLPGFKSGCYYFMAHTSERFDDFTTSMVAKYTPLSPEELHDGAFDLNWFFEAYEKLGEKEFKLLYDAAKYSSSGIAHGRARKYADAALGKVSVADLKTEIDAKRNKDLLMSIGLVPLADDREAKETDMLERYQFIQKFKKESRQFGAQRRASEGRAAEIAMRNLSVAAGFTDVTRLTLRMETKLAETLGGYFEWKVLDEETEIRIFVDEDGKSSLECRKNGKALKSVPAKFKKDAVVIEYQDVNKKFKEQYSRTKQMMEQAMEDRTAFEAWELLSLQTNPVVRPIVEPLVVMTADVSAEADGAPGTQVPVEVSDSARLGFLTESGLMDWSGTITEIDPNEKLFIAHPFDMYRDGHWHEYQKLLFKRQLKQPFKQVFRELYVKLADELDKEHSLMFAGNQIQPQKTVAALKSRRWVADYEDGLQKVYYKENIVARIYAMADWFSPSDIEAPTLEYVVFTDRKTFETITVKDVPDIIYSEVMRDVDLAVSVAHAGGVDPETSHSTVEMRRAIVECNLELFKIKNVTLKDKHAFIEGKRGSYTVHLGSGVVHQVGGSMLYVIPVHSQQRGRIFLPFIDEDPKTAEIMSKILLFADDGKIKDPKILEQIK